ncbi:DUF2637 domain-containing protein [Streptomyces chartreusis]|uniref:DUF2637 domain-containing protein n=1 Tax=Streptomyces chartreusis TaxID=1969 RepID=UPI002E17E2B4
MPRKIRLVVLVLAVIAGALSFAHLHDLAAAAGQTGWKAWAYPVSVDLLLVCVLHRLRTDRSMTAWLWFLVALVASLGANIATAGVLDLGHVPAWLRIVVAGWPALAFLGGTLLAHSPTEAGDRVPVPPAPTPEPGIQPEPSPDPEPEAALVTAPEQAPALPAAAPAPSPVMPVPAALVDHARKVADDHHARTGSPIDTDTLRTRLGVPPHLADAIAAQIA